MKQVLEDQRAEHARERRRREDDAERSYQQLAARDFRRNLVVDTENGPTHGFPNEPQHNLTTTGTCALFRQSHSPVVGRLHAHLGVHFFFQAPGFCMVWLYPRAPTTS